MSYYLKSASIKAQIESLENGSSREGLNFQQVGNLLITVPESIEEQNIVVRYLDTEMVRLSSAVELIRYQIAKLRDYRQSLISEAVTGKIDVRAK